MNRFSTLTRQAIGAAINVHRQLGPGLFESAYQHCLEYELKATGLQVERERAIPLPYREVLLDCVYRVDFLVEDTLILELKSVSATEPIHLVQLRSYLTLSGTPEGLLFNFNSVMLREKIRYVTPTRTIQQSPSRVC